METGDVRVCPTGTIGAFHVGTDDKSAIMLDSCSRAPQRQKSVTTQRADCHHAPRTPTEHPREGTDAAEDEADANYFCSMIALVSSVPTWNAPLVRTAPRRVTPVGMEIAGATDGSLMEQFEADRELAAAARASYQKMELKDMIGAGPETGGFNKPWDPLNLSGDWLEGEADKLAWMRAAEIKHGRVCMAAFVGYCFTAAGIFFPGQINYAGTTFAELGTDPLAAWDALGQNGRAQIIGVPPQVSRAQT
eukprot:3272003-Prymnesium_polylepis.2